MESSKVKLSVNGKSASISIPIFYNNKQGIKILHSQKLGIPNSLVLVDIEYDEIKNSTGVCTPIGVDNFKYVVSDFRYDCENLMKNFQRLSEDEKRKAIDEIKEKYLIIEDRHFANYLKETFKTVTALLNFIFDFLEVQPDKNFSFRDMVKTDNQIIKSIETIKSTLQNVKADFNDTEIRTLQTNIDLYFSIQGIDISELFNRIKPTQELPLAIYNSYFKVLKSFDNIPEDMIEVRSDNSLILYVLNTNYVPQKIKKENYTHIVISEISSTNESQGESSENFTKYKVNITSNLNDGLDETGLINRIIGFLPKKPINCSYKQNDILVEYYMNIKDNIFYEQMFSDYIMLDDLISNILVSDESDIITRQKGGFVTYFRPNKFSIFEDFIGINISQIKVKPYEHKLHKNILKIDDNALHFKIRGINNIQKAGQIRNLLNLIITNYLQNIQDSIVNEYTEYIEDIQERLDVFKSEKEKIAPPSFLKYEAPDIFTGKFASKCSGREPILITPQEAELLRDEMDIMKFPLFGEGEPRYFRSDHISYPYIGLLINDSPDAQYPYYPCCFGTDQANNTKSLRYKYENKIEDEKEPDKKIKKSKRVEIFTSPQAMEDGVVGVLNPRIKNTLEILDPKSYDKIASPYSRYLRIGTINSPNSVLDAIIKSIINYNKFNEESPNNTIYKFGVPKNYLDLTTSERIQILKSVRKAVKNFIYMNITSQSTFSYELEALKSYIENEDNYLNIHMFWNILEAAFDIRLFLFVKPVDENLSSMGTPIYIQNYLRIQNKSTVSVLLLEHQGVKNIRPKYPQVENIIINMFTEEFDYNPKLWLSSSKEYDDIYLINNLLELMNDILNYNGSINKAFNIQFKNQILSQWADSYGKIRLLQFQNLCLLSDPLPPFSSPQINSIRRCDYKPCQLDLANQFLDYEGIKDYNYSVVDNKIVGVMFIKKVAYSCTQVINNIEGVRFYIPVIPIKSPEGLENSSSDIISPSFIGKDSIIERYNKFSKISKFLKEYTIWLFSKWLSSSGNNSLDSSEAYKLLSVNPPEAYNLLYRFADQGFIINSKVVYPEYIEREFNTNVKDLVLNGKLIVPSIEVRNRLMYNLNLAISRNKTDVANFHKKTLIKDYFLDISDFIQDNTYVLLSGLSMLRAWLNANTPPDYVINSRIIPGTDHYFFQLKNNLRTKYLAQPAKSLEHALYINRKWSIERYNPGYHSSGEVTNVEHKVYLYSDFLDYSTYVEAEEIDVEGEGTESEYAVLQYRQNNKDYYVALLPFIEC